uniref:Uncharacterized protein n=1 Tax=Sus scrofa TaxID=9823 RepID=A0A8D0NC73_PIG
MLSLLRHCSLTVVSGVECHKARALTPQTAETDAIRFLVGTQSLKYDNQVTISDKRIHVHC